MAKIGVVISSLYACGGEERVVSLMANEWVKQHEVTIFTFEDREREGNRNDYPLSEKIKVERVFHSGDSFLRKVIRIVYFRTDGRNGLPVSFEESLLPGKIFKGMDREDQCRKLRSDDRNFRCERHALRLY